MYRARIVLNTLTPIAPQFCGAKRFATWLLRSHPVSRDSKVLVAEVCRRHQHGNAAAEPFISGTTSSYVEEMYNAWLRDPTSVHIVSTFLKN